MARIRTFIAIDITAEIRAAGERLIRTVSPRTAGARWVRPENLHCTLKFLGELNEQELPAVCRQIGGVVKNVNAFSVSCRSVGVFPDPARPATLWLGIDQHDQLTRLRDRLDASLAELGMPRERRRFQGHITLARLRRSPAETTIIQEFLQTYGNTDFGELPVRELTCYRSDLRRTGPEYTPVGRFPLAT